MTNNDENMDNSDPKSAWIEHILNGLGRVRDGCAGVAALLAAELARRGVERTSRVVVRAVRQLVGVLLRRMGRPW